MTTTEPTTEENTTMKTTIRRAFGGKKKYAAIGLALLVIPGSAYAAWTLTAHGQGSARVGTLAMPTVSAGTPTGTVMPGGTTAASFRIDNPNASALEVYGVQDGNGTGSTSAPLCDAQNLVVQPSTLATPIPVPPGQSTVEIPSTFRLLSGAPVECAGQTLSMDVKLLFRTAA